MTPAIHSLGKAFFVKRCSNQFLKWRNCQSWFQKLPLPTQYRIESVEEMPGRMALRLQMMCQSPAALELLNILVFNVVMRHVLVCVMNSHVGLQQHVCAKK